MLSKPKSTQAYDFAQAHEKNSQTKTSSKKLVRSVGVQSVFLNLANDFIFEPKFSFTVYFYIHPSAPGLFLFLFVCRLSR